MPWPWAVFLVVLCTVLNASGFIWHFFEPVPLYDEIAHFITPFTLVALTAEIIYRAGGDDVFFNTPRHALITGATIGLVGAGGWEVIEAILAGMGFPIANPPLDTAFDIFLGVLGGAAGAWFADRYLDRLFRTSRTDPDRRRVR